MPRASRCFLPGYVWHLTHRCHDREFLLKAARDRDLWRRWLWEATSRYGLSVLDFVATSNHIHLLVHDESGEGVIARSMQLVQGRTAQSYNWFRGRRGGYWQDRYHAVAVESGEHLWRCLVYIDLNMVRAGAVPHPREWRHGGYCELQSPRARYRILDLERLTVLTGCGSVGELQSAHRDQVEARLTCGDLSRDSVWTESVAVGSESFVETVRLRLGLSKRARITRTDIGSHALREDHPCYALRTPARIAF